MVASPNGIIGLYGDRSLTQRFERAVADRGERSWPVDIHGASDHAPFERVGIPAGGIFAGAGEHLTGEQADPDGKAGEPYDSCYHRAGDTYQTVDTEAVRRRLDVIADVAVTVVAGLL